MPIKDPTGQGYTKWKYLDDEVCFDTWNLVSNQRKAAKVLEDQGYRNPDTGRPPTGPGVYVAALRFMVWNPEAARQKIVNSGGAWANDRLKYLTWVLQRGNRQSNLMSGGKRKVFNKEIVDHAAETLSPEEFEIFLERYRDEVGEEDEDCTESDEGCEEAELVLA